MEETSIFHFYLWCIWYWIISTLTNPTVLHLKFSPPLGNNTVQLVKIGYICWNQTLGMQSKPIQVHLKIQLDNGNKWIVKDKFRWLESYSLRMNGGGNSMMCSISFMSGSGQIIILLSISLSDILYDIVIVSLRIWLDRFGV